MPQLYIQLYKHNPPLHTAKMACLLLDSLLHSFFSSGGCCSKHCAKGLAVEHVYCSCGSDACSSSQGLSERRGEVSFRSDIEQIFTPQGIGLVNPTEII